MVGQERRQVRPGANGTDARATSAVGDGEGLVEVQVPDVGPEVTGLGQTDHGVEIGPVDVDLATVLMDDVGEPPDPRLEHPVGRGR